MTVAHKKETIKTKVKKANQSVTVESVLAGRVNQLNIFEKRAVSLAIFIILFFLSGF